MLTIVIYDWKIDIPIPHMLTELIMKIGKFIQRSKKSVKETVYSVYRDK